MTILESTAAPGSLLAALFSNDVFHPAEPDSIGDTGLPSSLVEALICKYVLIVGSASGRQIAEHICLPFRALEDVYRSLRQRQILVH
ncbi:MAG: AAA family ATPase, partial [Planctomycetes bacterium]|nr:AAA family ATPase [Planctomycetota bacterium]